jgi:hypothetical protein
VERVLNLGNSSSLDGLKKHEASRVSGLVIQKAVSGVAVFLALTHKTDLDPHWRCAHRGLFGDEVDLSSDVAHRASLPMKAAPLGASKGLINACSDFIRSRL